MCGKWKLPDTKDVTTTTTTQMLGVGLQLRHMKGSDTSKAKLVEICFRLPLQFTKRHPRNSRRLLLGKACRPLSKHSASFALRCWVMCKPWPPAPGHISNDLTAWPSEAISYTTILTLERCFYLPVKIWIIVSTVGFNLLKDGKIVKEVQRKQPLCVHYPLQTPKGA